MQPEIKNELIRLVKNSLKQFKFSNQIESRSVSRYFVTEICKLTIIKINDLNKAFCDDKIVLEYLHSIETVFDI